MKYAMLGITFLVGALLWITTPPEGVSVQAWHLFAIFIATIFGMIAKPLPMGAMALVGLAAVVVTKTLSFEVAFSGFSNNSVWLVVFAFFVARGFIKTGLGTRLSYFFMLLLGKKTLGLGYGIVATDLLLSPAIPSSTARTGGLILPIVEALAKSYNSEPHDGTSKRMGAFLIKIAMQSSCITSAMFMTSMSANPLIADIARDFGVEITWLGWAVACIVPGLVSLAIVPLLIYWLYPPEIKESPDAPSIARAMLFEMGPMKRVEWIMLATFALLLVLWIFAQPLELLPAITAMLGLVLLMLAGVLTWDDVRNESGAWETLIWFAALLTMATQLSKLGFTGWLSTVLVGQVENLDWTWGFLLLSLTYFYSHYLFASNLAHVGGMYATFLGVAIALGAPPGFAALLLAAFSSLFGALTQYSCGQAALLFGSGYVRITTWWQSGLLISFVNIFIWIVIGGAWWKLLGWW